MKICATWNDHALLLWAPDCLGASALALRDAVSELTPDALLASSVGESIFRMRLPARPDGSIAEPGDLADHLADVDVPVLRFSPAEAMDLLLSIPAPSMPATALPCPNSLRYWQILAQFVVRAIRSQRFYPTARRANTHHEASWRLHLGSAEEIERLDRFAGAMPPSCRAVIGALSVHSASPAVTEMPPALELVESFLSDCSDALIRRAAGSDPFFTRVQGLAREGGEKGQAGAGAEIRLLAGLLSPDHLIPGEARENDVLVDQAQLWSSRLGGAPPAAGWQLQFTLLEPDEDEPSADEVANNAADVEHEAKQERDRDAAPWRVTFSLTSLGGEKPLDAEQIWSDASPLSALGRQLPELRAVMQAELARAAEIFEPLKRILGAAAPLELPLTSAEAQQFLRQWSAELRAQSFAVDLPKWADEGAGRLSLIMALRTPGPQEGTEAEEMIRSRGQARAGGTGTGSRMGLDSLLEFDWRISLGGMELTADEFDSLVRRQTPLVRIRGHWLEIDADSAAAALELMERKKAGQTTLGDAFRAAFASGLNAGASPAISLSGNSWIKDLLDQLPRLEAEQLDQPGGFHGALRPYQLRGLQWLAFLDRLGIGGCLADDMGLGKTIQLIALLLHERSVKDGDSAGGEAVKQSERSTNGGPGSMLHGATASRPTLLFAPTSVVGNWVRELERFAPDLKVLLHHGPRRHRNKTFVDAAQSMDIVITSYALAHRDREDFARVKWHRLALDEAQRIKNPSAASSVAIRSLQAPRRVALTGTPIENHLSELWSIMDVLNPGLLGSARDFRERFAVPIEKLLDQQRSEHLRRMIRPFVLRRTKKDPEIAGDLPDKIEMKVFCNLTVEQAAMYERATSEMLGQIDAATGIRRRGLILAVLTRLKQICDHPVLIGEEKIQNAILDRRSGKSERLVEMLEEVTEESDSALVFTQYAQMGHVLHRLLAERLPGMGLYYLHGGTPQKQRDEMVRAFQETKSPAIFILSLRAGGLGLNLTAASHVFHYDRWWNPAIENQATDRAHRIGQTRQVQVHKFIAVGTVEERIDRLLAQKTQLAESIVGAGDEWLTDLSTNELREYLKLNEEAVGEF